MVKKAQSINRNIVECKVRGFAKDRIYDSGINRNIVECKVSQTAIGTI